MRILVVTTTFPQWDSDPRGAFLRRFWEHRARAGATVDVLAPRTVWCHGPMDSVLRIERFTYAPRPCSTLTGQYGILENIRARPYRAVLVPALWVGMRRAVARRLEQTRWDRVVAHMLMPVGAGVAPLCRARGVPFELYGHGTDIDVLLRLPRLVRARLAIEFADAIAIHVPSEDKRRRLVLAMPQLAARLRVSTMAETVARPPLPRCPEPGSVLFLGRLIRQKGVDDLIAAMARVGEGHLQIAGDGPERRRLRRQADRLGVTARFHGFVEGPAKERLLRSASVLCVPSREVAGLSEGAPLVIREADVRGLPVIATRVGGIPELCNHSKGPVDLVPPGDPTALADALRRHLQAPPLHSASGEGC